MSLKKALRVREDVSPLSPGLVLSRVVFCDWFHAFKCVTFPFRAILFSFFFFLFLTFFFLFLSFCFYLSFFFRLPTFSFFRFRFLVSPSPIVLVRSSLPRFLVFLSKTLESEQQFPLHFLLVMSFMNLCSFHALACLKTRPNICKMLRNQVYSSYDNCLHSLPVCLLVS